MDNTFWETKFGLNKISIDDGDYLFLFSGNFDINSLKSFKINGLILTDEILFSLFL